MIRIQNILYGAKFNVGKVDVFDGSQLDSKNLTHKNFGHKKCYIVYRYTQQPSAKLQARGQVH